MEEHECCRTTTEGKGHCGSKGGCGHGHEQGHEQGHECGCGHEHESKPLNKEDKIKMLKEYLTSLEQEVKGVSEKIAEMEKSN